MVEKSNNKNQIDNGIDASKSSWTFSSDKVAANFDEHVKKSVPLYSEAQDLITTMSDFFTTEKSIYYDLGCSTGALTRKVNSKNQHKNIKSIGIDNSKQMIKEAKKNPLNKSCIFKSGDITEFKFNKANLITSFYTIQFIHPSIRVELIKNIYESLNWGGGFFLFEKTRASDARYQDLITTSYFEYKQNNGFQNEQIFNKYMSLSGVLEPFSDNGNLQILHAGGFSDIEIIFKYAPFTGYLAIK
jgi:tRNA (cmo5U34)-methyltransferase